jgi:hypothetical protein
MQFGRSAPTTSPLRIPASAIPLASLRVLSASWEKLTSPDDFDMNAVLSGESAALSRRTRYGIISFSSFQ